MTTKTKEENLEEVGRCAYESIAAMVAALECDYDRLEELEELRRSGEGLDTANMGELSDLRSAACGNEAPEYACKSREDAEQRIHEDALSVEVRSDWATLGEDLEAGEFCILLTTGGPAVRICGELDEHKEPRRAWLEVQDWFTPWTQYFGASQETLLTYARCFYFGD